MSFVSYPRDRLSILPPRRGASVMMQPKQGNGWQQVARRKPWQHCPNPWVQPCTPWTCWSREPMHAFCLIQFQMAALYFEAQRFWNYTKPIHLCSTFWFPKCFTYVFIIVWITWEAETLWDNHGKCYYAILKVKYLESVCGGQDPLQHPGHICCFFPVELGASYHLLWISDFLPEKLGK